MNPRLERIFGKSAENKRGGRSTKQEIASNDGIQESTNVKINAAVFLNTNIFSIVSYMAKIVLW